MGVWTRALAKRAAFWLATAAVAPALVSYALRALVFGADRALEGSSQTLSLVPGIVGQYVRRAFYARTLAHCDRSVTIEFGALFSKVGARLDENVYVGPRCGIGLAHLERDVLLGPAVQIPSGRSTHGTGDSTAPIREQAGRREMITVGAGTWIGSSAVVMADIGSNTVIGAGSVVVHAVSDNVMAAGNPARVVKTRGSAEPGIA